MRTLGLDLGTNSIGWAVLDTSCAEPIVAKGVQIFDKGVGEEKNNEFSLASKRTVYRAARKGKRRRKLRKMLTLQVLVDQGMCPGLTSDDIKRWKEEKVYPRHPDFLAWLSTKAATADQQPEDPYTYRALCAATPLDLTIAENRYKLGRAFYHLAQRRGYKSNRVSGEDKDGAVEGKIRELNEKRGSKTLGQFFHDEAFGRERIRGAGHYTSRKQYEEEYRKICEVQGLSPELREKLGQVLFWQRPLKSQKGSVGPCVLEPRRTRAALSHPDFELFRALQLINNIRLVEPGETSFRSLTEEERQKVLDWNLRRKKNESFEAMVKQITPKKAKRLFGVKSPGLDPYAWQFNFRADAVVSECPVSARLCDLFGASWREELPKRYRKAAGKPPSQVLDDVWHSLVSFYDPEKLKEFAVAQLGLDEEDAEVFARPVRQGYGSLSLTAIRKILPWMKQGMIYSHAVFMGKLPDLFRKQQLDWTGSKEQVAKDIADIIETASSRSALEGGVSECLKYLAGKDVSPDPDTLIFPGKKRELSSRLEKSLRLRLGSGVEDARLTETVQQGFDRVRELYHANLRLEEIPKPLTIAERVKLYLNETWGIPLEKTNIYHPSAMETYPPVQGKLGSPRIASIKNPVFMRTMHRLRAVVNELIEKGVIDRSTRVRVEMARELTTANDRKAIYRYQKEREKENAEYREAIRKLGFPNAAEQDSSVLKYRLWIEQNETCIYTGKKISASEFLSSDPVFDLEHTIPRSRRFDDSQANLTLCDADFNRRIKKNKMPSELSNHEEILQRARHHWSEKIEFHEKACAKARSASRSAGEKDVKDRARQSLHYHQQHLRYWRDKLRNFETEEVPEGFTNRQLVDTRIITKYAVMYLKSGFDQVYSLKAGALTVLKEIWGLNEKHRDNHVHHCVDAIIAAVVSPGFYDELARYYHEQERWMRGEAGRPHAPEPWPGFARYLNERLVHEVLVVHHHRDLLLNQTRKLLRKDGKPVMNAEGQPIYVQGDSVRGALHQETNYAKVREIPTAERPEPGELFTVVRKTLDGNFKDIDKIVDPVVRAKVEAQKDKLGKDTIWFNEEKRIPIRHVRVKCKNDPNSLITLKPQRDNSKHEHKQHLFVANDSNYLVALYRGTVKGKPKGDWRLVSSIDAVRAAKQGALDTLLPPVDDKGLTLKHVLKTGTQVLFYENTPEELKSLNRKDLVKRLYRVTVMEGARCKFNLHQTSLSSGELGAGASAVNFEKTENRLNLTLNKSLFVVEGTDFALTTTGEIEWRF